MKKFLILLIITSLCKPIAQAQCPPGASGFEVVNPSCTGGCAVLLQGWPAGVIVNIFSASPLDSIGSSGIIPSSGTAFVCIPCHSDLIFASFVPNASNGCVILVTSILPVTLKSFTITATDEKPLLRWDVSSEIGNVAYFIQRSSDGNIFNDISIINGNGNAGVSKSYSYTDNNAVQGVNYYRLKIKDETGSIKYSSIVSATNQSSPKVKIFPNPVTGNSFNINVPAEFLPAAITISDAQGRNVYSNNITQTSSTINAILSSGIYALKIIGKNNTLIIQKIIKK
jgi:hypothetical protein